MAIKLKLADFAMSDFLLNEVILLNFRFKVHLT